MQAWQLLMDGVDGKPGMVSDTFITGAGFITQSLILRPTYRIIRLWKSWMGSRWLGRLWTSSGKEWVFVFNAKEHRQRTTSEESTALRLGHSNLSKHFMNLIFVCSTSPVSFLDVPSVHHQSLSLMLPRNPCN